MIIRLIALIWFGCVATLWSSCLAQITWQSKTDQYASRGRSVTTTEAGDIIHLATHLDYENFAIHAVVSKLDPNGGVVWSKSVGPTSASYSSTHTACSDGSLLIAGTFAANGVFLTKIDSVAEILWGRTSMYTDSAWASFTPVSVRETSNQDIVVFGNVHSLGTDYSMFLSRLTASGTTLWSKVVHIGQLANLGAHDMVMASNGDIILLAYTEYPDYALWMARFTELGEPIFAIKYHEIGYLDSKLFETNEGFEIFVLVNNSLLQKITTDAAGTPLAAWEYSSNDTLPWRPYDVVPVPPNGHVVTGYIQDQVEQAFIMRLDADGSVPWSNKLGDGIAPRQSYSIATLPDQTFIISGIHESDSTINDWGYSWPAAFVCRTDSIGRAGNCYEGFQVTGQPFTVSSSPQWVETSPFAGWSEVEINPGSGMGYHFVCATVSIPEVHGRSTAISVYPNPTSGQVTLVPVFENAVIDEIRLLNNMMQTVTSFPIKAHFAGMPIQLDLSGPRTGMYYLWVSTNCGSHAMPLIIE